MEETQQGSQYAVQIAVHTLRDRCKYLQQHVALLEDENVNLKIKCSRQEESRSSLSELDRLRAQVAQLSEQKDQLQNKVKMVTCENQDLWTKLSKLTRVNKSLGSQLTKINDTLTQHSTVSRNDPIPQHNLIRSKTFTKSELQSRVLQKNLEENDKISLELEDVSLKLSDSFSKQKKELDLLCSEISEMTFANDDLTTSSCGFLYDEELENDMFSDIQLFGDNLKKLRDVVERQQAILELNVKNMQFLKEKLQSKTFQSKKPKVEKYTSTVDLCKNLFQDKGTETDQDINKAAQNGPLRKQALNESLETSAKICPLCSRAFHDVHFDVFQKHVQDHFDQDVESYEML